MKPLSNFWKWYEENERLNYGLAAFLFTLQVVHLIWLTGDVVIFKLTGNQIFGLNDYHASGIKNIFASAIIIVDFLEIPAIITTSLVYINEFRKKHNTRPFLFLLFLNSQWLHIFWITDEFVLERFSENVSQVALPLWLAWIAILIDYLELPVIYDTINKFFKTFKKEGLKEAVKEFDEN